MQMYIFDRTVPERDGALENDIVVHENTHGISNRMTGGGTARYVKSSSATLAGTVFTLVCCLKAVCRLWRRKAWERAGPMRSQSTSMWHAI